MTQLHIYLGNNIPPDIECQVVSFLRVHWPWTFRRKPAEPSHVAGVESCSLRRRAGGVLISYATVIETTLDHAGETYKTLGLSSVLTYPPFRGEGHGRGVVDAATRYIRESDADIAILWCEPGLEGFYGESGWVATRESETLIGTRKERRLKDDPDRPSTRMMLFLSDKGKAGRPAFERQPLFVGKHTW
jgi:GNAT superfamily N-acetyltransferase